jgi:hypothetical protein
MYQPVSHFVVNVYSNLTSVSPNGKILKYFKSCVTYWILSLRIA